MTSFRAFAILCLMVLSASAQAVDEQTPWKKQWRAALRSKTSFQDLTVTSHNENKYIITRSETNLRLLHPQTGNDFATLEHPSAAIAPWVERQGVNPIHGVCGPNGLHLLQMAGNQVLTLTQVQTKPCFNLITAQTGQTLLLGVAGEREFTFFHIDETGKWFEHSKIPTPNPNELRLASSPHAIVAGLYGEETLTELSHRGIMQIPAGGKLKQVAAGPDGWVWSLQNQQALAQLSGLPISVNASVTTLMGLELDGDGIPDLVYAGEEGLPAIKFSTNRVTAPLEVEMGSSHPTTSDLDGDGCLDLVMPEEKGLSIYYGNCSAISNQVGSKSQLAAPPAPLPPTHQFKLGHNIEFHTFVGEELRVQLHHPQEEVNRFASSGGPLWLKVSPTGVIRYTPNEHDVGSWEVTILAWKPLGTVERFPLVLKVHKTKEAADEPAGRQLRRRSRSYSNTRLLNNRLSFGFGGSVGISQASNSWAFLGTDWVLSGSPHLSIQLDNPEEKGIWWSITGETAPWFRYLTENMEMIHYLSTLSSIGWSFSEKFQAGVFGQAGFFITAVGVRARWFPVHLKKSNTRHGMEFRLSWLPSSAGAAGYAAMFYTIRLPKGL